MGDAPTYTLYGSIKLNALPDSGAEFDETSVAPAAIGCRGTEESSYLDAGSQVEIRDEAGTVLAVGSLDAGTDFIGSNHECNFHFMIEEVPLADRYQLFVEGKRIGDRRFSDLEPVDDQGEPADEATAVQLTFRDAPVGALSEDQISEFDDARRKQKSAEYAEDFNRALFGKKGWLVHPPIQTSSDSSGYFKGRTRIENEEGRTRSATFTFTLLRDEQIVATLRGTALDVEPGEIVTLDLLSQDPFDPGETKWDFQVDIQT